MAKTRESGRDGYTLHSWVGRMECWRETIGTLFFLWFHVTPLMTPDDCFGCVTYKPSFKVLKLSNLGLCSVLRQRLVKRIRLLE